MLGTDLPTLRLACAPLHIVDGLRRLDEGPASLASPPRPPNVASRPLRRPAGVTDQAALRAPERDSITPSTNQTNISSTSDHGPDRRPTAARSVFASGRDVVLSVPLSREEDSSAQQVVCARPFIHHQTSTHDSTLEQPRPTAAHPGSTQPPWGLERWRDAPHQPFNDDEQLQSTVRSPCVNTGHSQTIQAAEIGFVGKRAPPPSFRGRRPLTVNG